MRITYVSAHQQGLGCLLDICGIRDFAGAVYDAIIGGISAQNVIGAAEDGR